MQTKILQAIKAHRPKSFIVLNFEGLVETLLIFVENDENIQVYEYRGNHICKKDTIFFANRIKSSKIID